MEAIPFACALHVHGHGTASKCDHDSVAATSGTVTGLADENIGLSFTGDDKASWSANGTSITGAATSVSGGCSTTSYNPH